MQVIKRNKYKLLLAFLFSIISTPATLIALIGITGNDINMNLGYTMLVVIFAILFFVFLELILGYNHLLKVKQKPLFWAVLIIGILFFTFLIYINYTTLMSFFSLTNDGMGGLPHIPQ